MSLYMLFIFCKDIKLNLKESDFFLKNWIPRHLMFLEMKLIFYKSLKFKSKDLNVLMP